MAARAPPLVDLSDRRAQWSGGPFATAGLQHPQNGHGQRHGGGLIALARPSAALDARAVGRCSPRSARLRPPTPVGVDPEQAAQGSVVDADGLGDLEEPDRLQPIQTLGAGLVAVDLRQSGRTRRDRRGSCRRCWRTGSIPGLRASSCSPRSPSGRPRRAGECRARRELAGSRREGRAIGLTPPEPAPELRGVQRVGGPGVASQNEMARAVLDSSRRAGTAAPPWDGMWWTWLPPAATNHSTPAHARRQRGEEPEHHDARRNGQARPIAAMTHSARSRAVPLRGVRQRMWTGP